MGNEKNNVKPFTATKPDKLPIPMMRNGFFCAKDTETPAKHGSGALAA
ncbi:hypothetical protein IGB42_01410 [Andreprevotia sp. IGB-42]|nr:hypothetical protein [Andreprevotia sp. IGB-42]KAF0813732.1 hypothetical protein IGB42_01410 [Andreprevotia sp. IGB-42]